MLKKLMELNYHQNNKLRIIQVFTQKKISIFLLSLCLLSSMWILGYDIGPYSLRVYLFLVLMIIIAFKIFKQEAKLFSSVYSSRLFLAYALLVIWIACVDLRSGRKPFDVLMYILSTHFLGILGFICVQFFINLEKEILFFTKILILAVSVSAYFSVMQFLGVDFFWKLSDTLNPAFRHAPGGIYRLYYPAGLAFFSIALTYHIITFGGFVWTWLYLNKSYQSGRHWIQSIILWLWSSVMLVAILISRSRSAVLSVIASVWLLLGFGVFSGYKRIFGQKRAYVVTALIFIIIISEFVMLNKYFSDSWNVSVEHSLSGGFGRLLQVKDDYRVKSLTASWSLFKEIFSLGDREVFLTDKDKLAKVDPRISWTGIEKILLGPGMSAYKRKYDIISPHNMIISSLLSYGIIGCFLLLGLLYYIFTLCVAALKKENCSPVLYFVIFGCIVGIFGNAINSLFHNDSYLYGTFVPWWIIGLLCSVIQLGSTEESLNDESSDGSVG